jgi:hypothetical protein
MKEFKNILLVSGSGRNCGKTTVACDIISHINKRSSVIGLKITPHFHHTDKNQEIVAEGDGYSIYKENNSVSNKDSSRMLRAGAKAVYFIKCNDEALLRIYVMLKKLLHKGIPVVCESGSFASAYKAGLHILIEGSNPDKSKKSYISNMNKADEVIRFEDYTDVNILF